MVKGVNKTIIEINETGNEYFEKIILYVSPKYSWVNSPKIKKAVGEELKKINGNSIKNGKSLRRMINMKNRRRAIFATCCVAALIVCATLITIALI